MLKKYIVRMCILILLNISFLIMFSSSVFVKAESSPRPLAIINGTLIDGTGAAPIQDAVLIIQGERIVSVGQSSGVTIPPEATVIDIKGATILPGFFNTHVHNAYDYSKLKFWAQEGVTTVRNLGGIPESVNKKPKYARLVTAAPLSVPGGYSAGSPSLTVTSVEEAIRLTNKWIDKDVNIIKLMGLESGMLMKWGVFKTMTDAEALAIVETAHKHNIPVSAHISFSEDLKRAIDAGVNDIAHIASDPVSDELIQRMISKDIYWIPTLEPFATGNLFHVELANLTRFANAGGKVAVGTDVGTKWKPGALLSFKDLQYGMPIKEVEWMQKAGMTSMQIIVAGTRHSAHVCNLEKDLGTLQAGKIADVLIIQGDPLQDIHALLNVLWVIHTGEIIRKP